MSTKYTLYLAVLPEYRTNCIALLREKLGSDLAIYASPSHLDQSVKTGIPESWYNTVRIHRFFGKAFLQTGAWLPALSTKNLIVDLNPRSLTAWILLLTRRILRRRTLVWGHMHPQRGEASNTAGLRKAMRRLSTGIVCYTYDDAAGMRATTNSPVWVAANAIYRRGEIARFGQTASVDRHQLVYVGRFTAKKRVDLLIRAFAKAHAVRPEIRLTLVGDGSQRDTLGELVRDLDLTNCVDFRGWVSDAKSLANIYSESFASASPGFAGLGLTQSLGFGVPQIISQYEPHSPEIELARTGGVRWAQDEDTFTREILAAHNYRALLPATDIANYVRDTYSAEAMSYGLASALQAVPQEPSPEASTRGI